MVIVLLANGFEELEAITPVDVLRRNNIDVRTVSITNEKLITGTHGIQVTADLIASDVPLDGIDMLILPGGMPGVKNLDASPITKIFIDSTLKNGGRLAAICAAPSIFGKHGMLTNIKATCFPGFEGEMLNAILVDADVVTDGVFTTAKDYKSASAFAEELVKVCDRLGIKPHEEGEEITSESEEDTDSFGLLNFSYDDVLVSDEEFFTLPEIEDVTEDEDTENAISNLDVDENVEAEIKRTVDTILDVYTNTFDKNISISIRGIDRGPRITRYEVVPNRGTRVVTLTRYYDDLALALGKEGVRMEAPIPGKSAIGIEVPNDNPSTVRLEDMKWTEQYVQGAKTSVPIGMDVTGAPVFHDVLKFPHALVCGATGMGKSVFINSILTSLIDKNEPKDLKLILIDPKHVEFSSYKGIPHLITPVINDSKQSAGALMWAVDEMERRYSLIDNAGTRNIQAYNEMVANNPELGEHLPCIVIVIDELSDLMMQVKDPVEGLIMRLAQKSRAAGIHLILGTQRPSFDVLTGTIRANIPTRICFKVTSQVDSRTVLESTGAEKLLSKGDMLFRAPSSSTPIRVQSAFISDSEVEEFTKEQREKGTSYDDAVTEAILANAKKLAASSNRNSFCEEEDDEDKVDQCFIDAVELAIRSKKISTSLLQRKLSIGYGKAAKYIDAMEELGIVSQPNGQKPRDVLITMEEWQDKLSRL